jgi:site-specific DNA recombinase
MPNCIIYARKSTKRDNDPRYQEKSLSHQVIDMRETAERHGLDIVEIMEESESAFFGKKARPVFAELLKKCEKWKIDYIIFDTYNRVARNMTDAEKVQMLLHNGKLKGVFIGKEKILYTPSDMKKFDISVWIAKQETQDKSDIVKRRMPMHAKEGRVMSKAPFGYRNVTQKGGRKGVEIMKNEADLVKTAFEMRIHGASYEEIGYYFKSHGVFKENSAIQKIIKNHFYTGMMTFAGEFYQGSYEPLVAQKVFNKANELGRGICLRKDASKIHLRGIVVNSDSTKPLTASVAKGKYVYYYDHPRWLEWTPRRVKQDEIFKAFEEVFNNFKLPDELKPSNEDCILWLL